MRIALAMIVLAPATAARRGGLRRFRSNSVISSTSSFGFISARPGGSREAAASRGGLRRLVRAKSSNLVDAWAKPEAVAGLGCELQRETESSRPVRVGQRP